MDACENGGVCRVWELVDESEAEWQNDTGAGEWVVAVNVTVNITCLCSDDYIGDQCEICTHLRLPFSDFRLLYFVYNIG